MFLGKKTSSGKRTTTSAPEIVREKEARSSHPADPNDRSKNTSSVSQNSVVPHKIPQQNMSSAKTPSYLIPMVISAPKPAPAKEDLSFQPMDPNDGPKPPKMISTSGQELSIPSQINHHKLEQTIQLLGERIADLEKRIEHLENAVKTGEENAAMLWSGLIKSKEYSRRLELKICERIYWSIRTRNYERATELKEMCAKVLKYDGQFMDMPELNISDKDAKSIIRIARLLYFDWEESGLAENHKWP